MSTNKGSHLLTSKQESFQSLIDSSKFVKYLFLVSCVCKSLRAREWGLMCGSRVLHCYLAATTFTLVMFPYIVPTLHHDYIVPTCFPTLYLHVSRHCTMITLYLHVSLHCTMITLYLHVSLHCTMITLYLHVLPRYK